MESVSRLKDVGVQWEPPDPASDLVQMKSWPDSHREVGVQCDRAETVESGVQVDLLTQALTGPSMQLQCVSIRPEEQPQGGALLHLGPPRRPRGRPRGRPRLNRDQTGTKPEPTDPDQTRTESDSRPREETQDQTRTKTWTRTRAVRPSRRYQDYELHESTERKRRRNAEDDEEQEKSHVESRRRLKTAQRRNGHDPNWTPSSSAQNSISHDAALRVKEEAGLVAGGGVVCDICGKVLRNKSSLTRHSLVHNGSRPFGCKYCPLRFNRTDNLRYHLRIMHPNGPAPRVKLRPSSLWLCHTCGKTFSCRSRLQSHEEIHSGVKPCKCPLCSKAYMRINDLKHHMRTVHPNGTASPPAPPLLLCHLCGRSFTCKSLLSLHLTQTHGGDRPHVCRLCGRKFSRRHQLTLHSATVHRAEELQERDGNAPIGAQGDPLVCDICGRRLKSAALLEAHVAMHSGQKPFQCEVCGKGFVAEQTLKKHQLHAHLKPKPTSRSSGPAPRSSGSTPLRPCSFPCVVCGRAFRFRSLLLAHAVVHSEERPFVCEVCPRSFRRRSHLTRHTETVHPDGRPKPTYLCPICGTDQKFSSKLQRHLLTHSGERPYACDRCSQTFARLANLQQHQIRVHGDHIQRRRRGYESGAETPNIVFSDDGDEEDEEQREHQGLHGNESEFKPEETRMGGGGGVRRTEGGVTRTEGGVTRTEGGVTRTEGGVTRTEGGDGMQDADEGNMEKGDQLQGQLLQAVVGEHNYGDTHRQGAGPGVKEGAGPGVEAEQTGENMMVAEDILIETAQGGHAAQQMESDVLEAESGVLGVETSVLEAESEVLGVESCVLEAGSEILEVEQAESAVLEVESCVMEAESGDVEVESCVMEAESVALEVESGVVGVESCVMEAESGVVEVMTEPGEVLMVTAEGDMLVAEEVHVLVEGVEVELL